MKHTNCNLESTEHTMHVLRINTAHGHVRLVESSGVLSQFGQASSQKPLTCMQRLSCLPWSCRLYMDMMYTASISHSPAPELVRFSGQVDEGTSQHPHDRLSTVWIFSGNEHVELSRRCCGCYAAAISRCYHLHCVCARGSLHAKQQKVAGMASAPPGCSIEQRA